MHDMRLKQPEFIYNAFGPFTKNEKIIQKFKETGDSRCIYQKELGKACFQHDMAHADFKYLLCDKTINIAKNLKYDGYQKRFASMVYNFLIKISGVSSGAVKKKLCRSKI